MNTTITDTADEAKLVAAQDRREQAREDAKEEALLDLAERRHEAGQKRRSRAR